jgi:hypothetical protein
MNKLSKLLFLAIAAIGFTSCLEDEMIEEQKYGIINVDANKILEIPTASNTFSLLIEDKATTLDVVPIHLAANDVAKEDIKVTLQIDAAASTFPSTRYTLPEGLVAVIPKGSRDGALKLNMNPKDLDPSNPYKLVFSIVSVDQPGYIISGNFNKRTATFSARNAYEGVYRATGVFVHPTAGARDINRDKTLKTINTTTSETEFADLGGSGWTMWLVVNPDNTVTLIPKGSASTSTVQTGINKYDPATKTFTLSYNYPGGGGNRVVTETIKRK